MFRELITGKVDISRYYTRKPRLEQLIDNTVYQTFKSPVLSRRHARKIRDFIRLNPDYSFEFFDDQRMQAYMEQEFPGRKILEVFNRIRIPASKADIWRYCILFKQGGVYCDIDSALGLPLRELIGPDSRELIAFESNTYTSMADPAYMAQPMPGPPEAAHRNLSFPEHPVLNWFLVFSQGHPILRSAIEHIESTADFYFGREFESVWKAVIHATGPIALTHAIWKELARKGQTVRAGRHRLPRTRHL